MRRQSFHEFLRAKEDENARARDAVFASWRAEYQEFLQDKLASLVWHAEHHCHPHGSPHAAVAMACGEAPRMKLTTTATNSNTTASTCSNNAMMAEDTERGAYNGMEQQQRHCRTTPATNSFSDQTPTPMSFDLRRSTSLGRCECAWDFIAEKDAPMFVETHTLSTAERAPGLGPLTPAGRPTTHDGQRPRTELNASKATAVPSSPLHGNNIEERDSDRDDDRTAILVVSPPPRQTPLRLPSHAEYDPSLDDSLGPAATTATVRAPVPAVQLQKMIPAEEVSKANLRKTIARLYSDAVDSRGSGSDTGHRTRQGGSSPPLSSTLSHMMHLKPRHVGHGTPWIKAEALRHDMVSKEQVVCELRRLYGLEDEC